MPSHLIEVEQPRDPAIDHLRISEILVPDLQPQRQGDIVLPLEELHRDRKLAVVVAIEGLPADARLLRDVVDGCRDIALPAEDALRRLDEPPPALFLLQPGELVQPGDLSLASLHERPPMPRLAGGEG